MVRDGKQLPIGKKAYKIIGTVGMAFRYHIPRLTELYVKTHIWGKFIDGMLCLMLTFNSSERHWSHSLETARAAGGIVGNLKVTSVKIQPPLEPCS